MGPPSGRFGLSAAVFFLKVHDDVIDIVTHSRRACGKHTADHRLGAVRRFTFIDLHMISKTLITDDLCHTSRELPVDQVVIDRIKDRLDTGTTPDLMKWV